jgi:hypothetical protein
MPDETTVEAKFLQLAMAFGQGAGVMLATEEALLAAREAYAGDVRARAPEWNEYALQAIEYGRILGSLAAEHALRHSRCVIDVPDVRHALGVVQTNERGPVGFCRITMRRATP